ncbi:MAG: DNA polymerase I [Firmicutes bacterium]|nr:DNA polymerase I [Bacillota bacterium]
MKRIVIIDGNSLINRAFYAMQRPMITSEGIYTQGIYGFLNMLNKIEDDYSPEYMAVAFDLKDPTFRHKEYEGYKAGRKPMPPELAMEMPILKDILKALNIRILEVPGYEADDIIGTVSRIAEEQGMEPMIFTGDKDALQLTSDITKVVFTKKGVTDFDLYDREKMLERYGLTPEQFIDLKGIMGDSSDCIPGIPGIGEKGGIELLTQFGSLENVLEHSDEITKPAMRKKVEENADLARLSKHLATIVRDVPLDCGIEDMVLTEPDYEELTAIYKKLEFKSFLKRLGSHAVTEAKAGFSPEELEFKGEKYVIGDQHELWHLYELRGKDVFVTLFGEITHVGVLGVDGVFFEAKDAYYVDLRLVSIEALNEVLNEIDMRFFGHDIKETLYAMYRLGIVTKDVAFDTSIAEYCLDVSRKDYSLRSVCLDRLGFDPYENMPEGGAQLSMFSGQHRYNISLGNLYAGLSRALRRSQEAELREKGLERVFYECELPLISVLASMEDAGIICDGDYLDEFGKNLAKESEALEKDIYELAGEEFNIKSTIQLGEILFEKLKLPHGKKTKRGYSTNAEVLEKIRDEHPIVDKILEYRNLTKLASTYVEGMKPLIADDGRIHCHFQQTVTQTGRISCTEPNLQNIPVRQELGRKIRRAFHAGEGKILVGADYSQIELRVLAHLSGDEALIEAFNNNEDIHRMTAARVLGIPLEEVRPIDRSRAKAVNFGVIYGMSSFGLSEEINVTRKEAEAYIKEYFNKHPGVKAYMDEQVRLAKERGYSETILGRKRRINEISASNFMVRQLGERLAMNTPIQGSAADIIKIAMNRVHAELTEKHPGSRLILQVHDELIIEADINELDEIRELLTRNMQEAMELKVKLLVDLNTADNWYDLK